MTSVFLGLPSPRLPIRRSPVAAAPLAIAAALHVSAAACLILTLRHPAPTSTDHSSPMAVVMPIVLPPQLLFAAGPSAGGGGGGGNRQPGPIRHAEGKGHDRATLRTSPHPPRVSESALISEQLPSVVLDAKSLSSGSFDQVGLPVGGVSYGTSTGPGTGGGVGTGVGTGLGSGNGPGVGPGEGGGMGGGAYRPGGAVTAPRVITQSQPRYTTDALERKIQGSVWLEVVVTKEGLAGAVQVVRSLDPRGLDDEAITAVRLWRFEPGRISGRPVDVIVSVVMDFSIR